MNVECMERCALPCCSRVTTGWDLKRRGRAGPHAADDLRAAEQCLLTILLVDASPCGLVHLLPHADEPEAGTIPAWEAAVLRQLHQASAAVSEDGGMKQEFRTSLLIGAILAGALGGCSGTV